MGTQLFSLIQVTVTEEFSPKKNLSFRFAFDLVDLPCLESTKNPHMTNDRRYPPVLAMLQNHNNGVPSNGSDKALRGAPRLLVAIT